MPAVLFFATWYGLDLFRVTVWTLSPVGSPGLESRAELVVRRVTVALAVGGFVVRRRRAGAPG